MSNILPIPQTFALVDAKGQYTPFFKTFLDQVLARIGGVTGGSYTALPIGTGAVVWDLGLNPICELTLTEDVALTALNQVAGNLYPYRITLAQDAAGSRTVSWGPQFKFPSGAAPALSSAPNAVDVLLFVSDGTNMVGVAEAKDVR